MEIHEERQAGDVDLSDWAVSQTILHGGEAYVIHEQEVPTQNGQQTIAAVMRW
jgi:hypothetical protein